MQWHLGLEERVDRDRNIPAFQRQNFDYLFHEFLPIGHSTNIECRFEAADIIMLVVGFERMTVGWRREVWSRG